LNLDRCGTKPFGSDRHRDIPAANGGRSAGSFFDISPDAISTRNSQRNGVTVIANLYVDVPPDAGIVSMGQNLRIPADMTASCRRGISAGDVDGDRTALVCGAWALADQADPPRAADGRVAARAAISRGSAHNIDRYGTCRFCRSCIGFVTG
jgi:hypothetical protein